MTSSEKFCLRWNDFESNISLAFRELREEKDFFDVTLACDDSQIQAHKVILSACSPFFRNVLRRNPHQHPLLYLKGVKYQELLSVLNFMYMGEVNVAQEELNSFLAVAEDLRVKGLTQNNASGSAKPEPSKPPNRIIRDPPDRSEPTPPAPKRPRPPPPAPRPSYQPQIEDQDDDIQEVVPVKSEPREAPVVVQEEPPPPPPAAPQVVQQYQHHQEVGQAGGTVALDTDQGYGDESYDYGQYGDGGYDDGSGGMIDPNTGLPYQQADGIKDLEVLVSSKMTRVTGGWQCLECPYSSKNGHNVSEHVEARHVQHAGYNCDLCEKVCPTKSALRMHIKRSHQTPDTNLMLP